jgi:hypothetical protein
MLEVLVALVVIGFLLWLVLTYIPMPDPFKKVIIAVAVLFLVLLVLRMFGFVDVPMRLR